jgi:predicted site-specific integrase-resolvase
MTLTEYSRRHNLSRKTAWNHFKRGLIKGAHQLSSGKIIIPDEESQDITILLFKGSVEEIKRRLGL